MKIIVFAPHGDDEIFGCGGSILKWIEEGHEVHIVYITDNRALIKWGRKDNQLLEDEAKEFINLSDDQLADICLKESEIVAKHFRLPKTNIHFFKFHDLDAENRIEDGVKLSKTIIKDANRIVVSSDNNNHPDHQATHTIAKTAAKELELKNIEFYIYSIYGILKAPKEKQIKIRVADYQDQLFELMKGYKTQLCLKDTRLGWETLNRRRFERFGIFQLEDAGKFVNF